MKRKSRAGYYRQRRAKENYKIFTAEIDREKLERFEQFLILRCQTKVAWLNEKIDEAIGKE